MSETCDSTFALPKSVAKRLHCSAAAVGCVVFGLPSRTSGQSRRMCEAHGKLFASWGPLYGGIWRPDESGILNNELSHDGR